MSKKVAYVTGGMGGIGTAICQRLFKEGFTVVAGCGPTRDFDKWLNEQKALGYTFYASVGNVGDWDSTVEAFSKTKAEHGSIDVLVNNAGITRDRMFLKMTREDWDAVIETNLNSMFNVTKQVVGDMVEKGWGRIINIASAHGLVGSADKSAYVAAKHGLIGLTKVAAIELANSGITCTAICPGWVLTPLVQAQLDARANADNITVDAAAAAFLAEKQPMHQFTKPEQIGATAVFLCSDGAATITGSAISVDGGWVAE